MSELTSTKAEFALRRVVTELRQNGPFQMQDAGTCTGLKQWEALEAMHFLLSYGDIKAINGGWVIT